MDPQSDWNYIKPLYIFCNIFAIFPPHTFGQNPTPVSTPVKIYALIKIFSLVAIYIYSANGRRTHLYENLDITVTITDQLSNIFLTVLAIMVIFSFNFLNSTNIKSFINEIYHISRKPQFSCYTTRNFCIQFHLFNAYMALILGFDAYMWISTISLEFFQFYIGRSVMFYACNLTVFFIVHSALIIKQLFASLLHLFETVVKALVRENDIKIAYVLDEFQIKCVPEVSYKCSDLKRVRKYYSRICDLVDCFNKIYGWTVLLGTIFTVTYILNLTDVLLVYAVRGNKTINGILYGNELIMLNVSWIVTMLGFCFILSKSCADAVSECENVSTACFRWLNEIPTVPKTSKEQILKEEVLLLIHQVTARKPKFSAAGFFVLDFTLIGFIVGSVTTYVIVSVQFIETT